MQEDMNESIVQQPIPKLEESNNTGEYIIEPVIHGNDQHNISRTNRGIEISDDEDETRNVENIPRFMRNTRASLAGLRQTSAPKPKPVRSSTSSTTNTLKNPPHFMQNTKASQKHLEEVKSEPKQHKVKELDMSKLPRYMQQTKASQQHIEKQVVPKSPKKVKELDITKLPHFMGQTQTSRKHKEESAKPEASPRAMRAVDMEKVPHFMQPTVATRVLAQSKEEDMKRREEEMKKKEEEERMLLAIQEKWGNQRVKADEKIYKMG